MLHFYVRLLVLSLLSVITGATKDVNHVGCFKTSAYVNSNHGTIIKPVTWDICIHLCVNKQTTYAGLQSRNNTCFCGSDMHHRSAMVDQSHCQPCYEDSTKWCGGYDTLSLYQLKPTESSQLGILLATDGGIWMMITDNSNSSETVQLSETSATSIAYHFQNQEIYFTSKNNILKLSYVPLLMKYNHPLIIVDNICTDLSDLDLNWENNTIYWSCPSKSEIRQADLKGVNGYRLIHQSAIQNLAFEPYAKIIFYARYMILSKYDYKTSKANILDGEYSFKRVFQLAIDIQQEVIYVIGSYDANKKPCLVSLNYDCTVFKVIHQGVEFSNPIGLDAFNGTIIWGNEVNSNYKLYRGKISCKGHLEKIAVIYTGTQKINDLRIYHPEAQSPSTDFLCRKKECSHGCTVITSVLVQCTCPPSTRENFTSVLSNDSRTCIDIPTYKLYSQTSDWITSTSESVTSKSLFTEDIKSSTKYVSTDYITKNEESENRFKTEDITEVGTYTKTRFSGHYTPKSSQLSKVTPNQESVYHLFYSCGLILILVFVIPSQVYLVIWLRRTNRTFTHFVISHRQSELVELT